MMDKTAHKKTIIRRDARFREIQAELRTRIRRGHWAQGSMIPSRRALADEFSVSVPTIQKAVTDMVSEGLLRVDANRTFVFGDNDAMDVPAEPIAFSSNRASVKSASRITGVALVGDLKPTPNGYLTNPLTMVILDEVESGLSQYGYSTRFYNRFEFSGKAVGDEPNGYGQFLEPCPPLMTRLIEDRPAVIIVTSRVGSPAFIRDATDAGIGVVAVASVFDYEVASVEYNAPFTLVAPDQYNEGCIAAKHLIDAGCRDILYFAPFECDWVSRRYDGIRLANRAAGRPPEHIHTRIAPIHILDRTMSVHESRTHREFGYEYARSVVADLGHFDGVIAANDLVARGYIDAAREIGREPGRDYAIVGFDDKDFTRELSLTTVHPPWITLGREAARAAATMLQGVTDLGTVHVKSRLIQRDSSRIDRH